MNKISALTLTAALSLSLTAASVTAASASADAASVKERIQVAGQATYYGEVKEGMPSGRGTISWGTSKQYSGDFISGKRDGTGKYVNEYVSDDEKHKIVYTGAWKQDQMNGKGTLTHKVTRQDGTVRWNEIQTGTFKNGVLQEGYDVIHAVADPDYSFTYKSSRETLTVMGSNTNMKTDWRKGTLFSVDYLNGSVHKVYSIFPGDTKAEERKNQEALKYLQRIQTKINPYLEQFEKLSKQLPLK
ncbi:hypothetical protein [Paenibacillus sp. J22TS3]|uniref:hypothetical protein n=1 Tax=Paenibacillus sp. J22TS3 TaxID=2807192 RepID=UPI001AFCF90D|nr:hypothetical protein [Paenibacillus sp. J22TS3]GIP22641.1 hypothetical protein J22TS3_29160 [Paenibacillus sp. J22TS3]